MPINGLPIEGAPTPDELQFTGYLLDGISHYIAQKPIDRSVLIAALSKISQIVFCEQTPLNIKEQCMEIDAFCNHLKKHALKDAGFGWM